MNAHFDAIVIGVGSGKGVAASRLSEDPGRSVLLIEAGADFPHEADMPPLVAVSSEHTWRVSGAPEFDWGFFDFDQAGRRGAPDQASARSTDGRHLDGEFDDRRPAGGRRSRPLGRHG